MCSSDLRERPDSVLAMGSFTSLPAALAAVSLKIPLYLHDGNARIGKANRFLSRFARNLFLSYPAVNAAAVHCPASIVGMPTRPELRPGVWAKKSRKEILGDFNARFDIDFDPEKVTLLIFGGSQGAQAINSAMLEAVERSPILRESVTITHQTGVDDYERVRRGYEKLGIEVDVQPFLFDMPKELANADLVICRAGASTLAELAAYGKVGILIPFPHATHNHQEMNALAMEKVGAARLLRQSEMTGQKLVEEIEGVESAADLLRRIKQTARESSDKGKVVRKVQTKSLEKSDMRKSIIDVLTEEGGEIEPSLLMQKAGFDQAEIEEFYYELGDIAGQIVENRPGKDAAKNWPYDETIKIGLRK